MSHESHSEDVNRSGLDLTFFASSGMLYACCFCVFFSCVLSAIDIRQHAVSFDYPKIQVYVIRVLFMIPVYGIFSLGSMIFPPIRFFLDSMRDTYEAIVLYMFFSMLIAYAGGEGQLIKALNKKRYKGVHPYPMCCLPLFPLDQSFFLRCKRMVLQYAIFKPVAAILAFALQPFGLYTEANFSVTNAYLYLYIIYNFSISYSLYYLVLFEIETERELRYCQAGMKFLCIKSIIFFAFWQSCLLSLLIGMGAIYTGDDPEMQEHMTTSIQNGLICLELLPVSFLHHYGFGRSKLEREMAAEPVFNIETEIKSARQNLDQALRFDGVFSDLLATVFYRKGKLIDMEGDVEEGDHEASPHDVGGMKDPTEEELVRFAFSNDRGIRPEGLLYIPDSEDDFCDDHIEYKDTDIIDPNVTGLSRVDGTRAAEDLVAGDAADIGAIAFCSVCGRFDREMVKRKSGFKCTECVGSKSIAAVKKANKKSHETYDTKSEGISEKPDQKVVNFR